MWNARPLTPLSVAVTDRVQLVAWSKWPRTVRALAMRSRIILLAAGYHARALGFLLTGPLMLRIAIAVKRPRAVQVTPISWLIVQTRLMSRQTVYAPQCNSSNR
jgi:hypothetical protein